MFGRILCRVGWHRWDYADATDEDDEEVVVVTYSWCKRKGCPYNETTHIVNIDRLPKERVV